MPANKFHRLVRNYKSDRYYKRFFAWERLITMLYGVLSKGSMAVFDKAYNHYHQFAKWSDKEIFFVTRIKKNAVYEIQEVMFENKDEDISSGVCKDGHIHLCYKEGKILKILCLRKVDYTDEKGIYYQFFCNNWDITAEEVALLYKKRWSIGWH